MADDFCALQRTPDDGRSRFVKKRRRERAEETHKTTNDSSIGMSCSGGCASRRVINLALEASARCNAKWTWLARDARGLNAPPRPAPECNTPSTGNNNTLGAMY